jgi:hypothetical protein
VVVVVNIKSFGKRGRHTVGGEKHSSGTACFYEKLSFDVLPLDDERTKDAAL